MPKYSIYVLSSNHFVLFLCYSFLPKWIGNVTQPVENIAMYKTVSFPKKAQNMWVSISFQNITKQSRNSKNKAREEGNGKLYFHCSFKS